MTSLRPAGEAADDGRVIDVQPVTQAITASSVSSLAVKIICDWARLFAGRRTV